MTAVFTARDRGTVAAGIIESGHVRAGDPLVIHHGDALVSTRCLAVELVYARSPAHPRTMGVLLEAVRRDQVGPGDVIEGTPI